MRRRWIYAIQITLSLVMVIGLATSCAVPSSTSPPSSTPTPPASEYPADISGRVTIADKVVVELPNSGKKFEPTPLGKERGWWIVDVSVKNKDYEKPITSIWDTTLSMPIGTEYLMWSITMDGKVWGGLEWVDAFIPAPMSVDKGQDGKTTFLFEVPNKYISLSDLQICYRGQEPYSYGKLSGGDRVAVYDWDLKKAVEETEEPTTPTPTVIQVTIQELNRAYMGNVF